MDLEYFEQFKANNERAITSYFDRHASALVWYANSIIVDVELAEEIVQDAYIKLWAARERIHSEAHIKSFLYTVTRNTCIDHLRKASIRPHAAQVELDAELVQPDTDLLSRMIHAETLQLVYREVQKLPLAQQQVFRLIFIEGLDTEEVCAQLKMTPNAVFVAKSKALSTLQKIFRHKDALVYLLFLKLFNL